MKISSALTSTAIRQQPAPLIVGERLNVIGSAKTRRLVRNDDYEGLMALARQQVNDGAHCLDVCLATNERDDEKEMMVKLIKMLSGTVSAPLVIDTTEPDVMEAALRQVPGRPIMNSIHLEGDGSRYDSMAPIVKKYGCPVVAMCIGPDGQARTAQGKLRVATMIAERGIPQEQLIFDPLIFPLGVDTEQVDGAVQTLKAIKLIKKKFPRAHTILGISNLTNGMKPAMGRAVKSCYLYHCIKAGLDCVIINPRDILPYDSIPHRDIIENAIFNRAPDCIDVLVEAFTGEKLASQTVKKIPGKTASDRLYYRIVERIPDKIEQGVVDAISQYVGRDCKGMPRHQTHDAAIQVLNKSLLPAMKEVGDQFGAGQIVLPFVLRSAECMKSAVAELELHLSSTDQTTKGVIVLGTVYGDVHDIGKNLVKTILQNNGYTVHDIGKQVPIQKFVDAIAQYKPNAVGLSALLVNTSKQMRLFVEYAKQNDLDIPILCGGAAINSGFISRIINDTSYSRGVFYCGTMFDGLKVMDRIVSDYDGLIKDLYAKLKVPVKKVTIDQDKIPRSSIKPVTPPSPPFYGARILQDINPDDIWEYIDMTSLMKLSWGLRGRSGQKQIKKHGKILDQWKQRIKPMLDPVITYGYFRCSSHGRHLRVGDQKFEFPRTTKSSHLCLADYFGDNDVVGFQVVTVGARVGDIIAKWDKQGHITDAYYLHGLAVEFAEALAAYTNNIINTDLGCKCLRYSWGYPSCPDVSQHHILWKILNPPYVTLSEAGQIIPEQSTAAIVVHHPDAKYFV